MKGTPFDDVELVCYNNLPPIGTFNYFKKIIIKRLWIETFFGQPIWNSHGPGPKSLGTAWGA